MTVGSLFSGVGGFDLGLERAGMTVKWQVEIDDFCNKVLAKHWPDVKRYRDVRECGKHNLEPVDLICGGYPCQPFSIAGKRQGAKDDRHLWPEMFRIIQELKPTWCLCENVAGHVNMGLDDVLSDLEAEGYATFPLVIPACAVDAKHRRDRVWIVAHTAKSNDGISSPESALRQIQQSGNGRVKRDVADTRGEGLEGYAWNGKRGNQSRWNQEKQNRSTGTSGLCHASIAGFPDWAGGEVGEPRPITEFERSDGREVERNFRGISYGVSRRVERLRALGNAVVPQIVEIIGRAIMEVRV